VRSIGVLAGAQAQVCPAYAPERARAVAAAKGLFKEAVG
jgi:hypothetical protein